MNRSWYLFYGYQLGMDRHAVMTTRVGEMQDLIACLAIYNGGADQKIKRKASYEDVMAMR